LLCCKIRWISCAVGRTSGACVLMSKKCKVMHFGRNNPYHTYEINAKSFNAVNEERDIGVTVSRDLKPSAQCAKTAGLC
jgi:hypothetical protein